MSIVKNKVYLFDFDGTLTRSQTITLFLRHVGASKWQRCAYGLRKLMVKIHLMSADTAVERTLRAALRRYSEKEFADLCESFADVIESVKSPSGMGIVTHAQAHNIDVRIVSDNIESIIRPWALRHNIVDVTATQWDQSRLCLATPVCDGVERVHRLAPIYIPRDQYLITAFGDSRADSEARGDTPMFLYADSWLHLHRRK